jgi:hypothetical protein
MDYSRNTQISCESGVILGVKSRIYLRINGKGYQVSVNFREICPNCIDLTECTEERLIVLEEELYLVEKTIRYCQACNQELSNTVTLKFKHRMG